MKRNQQDQFDLDDLLHPAQAFGHPLQVVNDPDLTLNEKRAILSAWASDACAIEAAPELRQATGGRPVKFDDIIDALKVLDKEANERRYRYRLARHGAFRRGNRDDHGDEGHGRTLQ
jgi:hypothetical protein